MVFSDGDVVEGTQHLGHDVTVAVTDPQGAVADVKGVMIVTPAAREKECSWRRAWLTPHPTLS